MKKIILLLFLIISGYSLLAQYYEIDKLKTISKIWGECYLFHPSIVRADKEINWEKQLVEFLPSIQEPFSPKIFLEKINAHLLAALDDPLTIVQSYHTENKKLNVDIAINLKAFSNVVFVGEQTQGTDGEMTKIHLPGGGETSFTGQIVNFGNGETFQGKGIIPDFPVQQTIEGIKNNRDEILEKAIEILDKN